MTRAEALESLRVLIVKNMLGAPGSETRIHRELMLELVEAEIARSKQIYPRDEVIGAPGA